MQIRSRGGPEEHSTPLGAIYRIRIILLEKKTWYFKFKS
jgi:hypothetical protein